MAVDLSFRVPRTWPQLRAVGICIRSNDCETTEERNEILARFSEASPEHGENMLKAAQEYLTPFYETTGDGKMIRKGFEGLKRQVLSQAKQLGGAGYLATSDLSSKTDPKDAKALLPMFIHAAILFQQNDQFEVICTGTGEDDTSNFNSNTSWPEIFPNTTPITSSDCSFQYSIEYIADRSKKAILYIKTFSRGEKLRVLGDLGSGESFSLEMVSSDFISVNSTVEFKDQYNEAVSSLNPRNTGLAQFVSRVSSSHISERLVEEIMKPSFNIVCPEAMRLNAPIEATHPAVSSRRPLQPGPIAPDFDGPGGIPGFPMQPVGPGFYGDRDLFPTLPTGPGTTRGGGNIFGPGHPSFGLRPNGRPDGVPPGARYDPWSGPPRPNTGPTIPQGGRRPGRGAGGPDPDHFPPPGNGGGDDFGFYG